MSKETEKKEKKTNNTNSRKNNNVKSKNNNNSKTKNANKSDKKVVAKKNTEEKKETKSKVTKKSPIKKERKLEEKIVEEEFIEEYDEDLEDFFEEEEEEFEEEIIKPKKKEKKEKKFFKFKNSDNKEEKKLEEKIKVSDKDEKSNNKEEKISNKNIEKIAKKAKSKNTRNNRTSSNKLTKIGLFLEENKYIIGSFVAGVIVTTLIAMVMWPDRIATLKNGEQSVVKVGGKNYTANTLYEEMKDHYSISQLLDLIDNDLLTKLYPETDEMKQEVEAQAQNYISQYKTYYNYTEEQFLEANGFSSYNDFLDYLKLDYRRKEYLEKYVKDNLTDKEIEKYYNDNVYGDIKCEHVLVEVASDSDSEDSSKLSDKDAKKLAEEIIDKINDGTSWKDIQKEYKDKVTYEDLGYQSWDAELEDSFKDALKDMDDNSYSKEPVKTSYGYHVIYRADQKKTPSLDKTKDKIIEKLIDEKKAADSNLQYKALISLRNDKKIKFSDTVLKAKYDSYVKQYNK